MKLYPIILNVIVIVMLGALCTFVRYVGVKDGSGVPVKAPQQAVEMRTAPERVIMSIRELQAALNAREHSRYKCEVDGKWGPQTAKALDNYICDRQAIKEFK